MLLQNLKNDYHPEPIAPQPEEKLQWFRDAKYGMFLHWGLYSLLGRGEWTMFMDRINASDYARLADKFSAPAFDAAAWARTAKQAGMRYMVLTTRHHDGFCLFDSKVSAYNSMNTPAHRDFVREFADACRAEGLKVGFYYSPMDWRFPGYFFPELYCDSALAMRDQCREQLRELMTNYGKIDMIWFDGEWLAHGGIGYDHGKGWLRREDFGSDPLYGEVNYFWQSEDVMRMIRELQPDIIVNNRFGWEGDFEVRERFAGSMQTDKPWDSNDCLAKSWGYIPDMPVLSVRQVVERLVSVVTRDGNLLLNVGPRGDGSFDPLHAERLAQVGAWLREYGDTLYGTRGGPVEPGPWGGATYRGNKLYLHVTEWTSDKIAFENRFGRLQSARLVTGGELLLREDGSTVTFSAAPEHRHPYDTIAELTFDAPIVWEGVRTHEKARAGLGDGL